MVKTKAWALRTCYADGTSYDGFKWPTEVGSVVKCPDWDEKQKCGGGLHGLLDGFGNFALLSYSPNAIWQIVDVVRESCVELDRKVKFPECVLVYSGNMVGALTMFIEYQMNLNQPNDVIQASSEDYSRLASSEDYSRLASSGNNSRLASSGQYSRLSSSGVNSQLASSGQHSQLASSGNHSGLASSGDFSHLASSGNYSQLSSSGVNSRLASSGVNSQLASSGQYSQLASSGVNSQLASSGQHSQLSSSGKSSICIAAGLNSVASAGDNGTIVLTWWNEEKERYEVEVGHIGEKGIKPNVYYRLDENHQFVEA